MIVVFKAVFILRRKLAPPINLGAWSIALMLWLPFELLLLYTKKVDNLTGFFPPDPLFLNLGLAVCVCAREVNDGKCHSLIHAHTFT